MKSCQNRGYTWQSSNGASVLTLRYNEMIRLLRKRVGGEEAALSKWRMRKEEREGGVDT